MLYTKINEKNCKKKTFEVLILESICQTLKVKIILSNVKPNMVYLEKQTLDKSQKTMMDWGNNLHTY